MNERFLRRAGRKVDFQKTPLLSHFPVESIGWSRLDNIVFTGAFHRPTHPSMCKRIAGLWKKKRNGSPDFLPPRKAPRFFKRGSQSWERLLFSQFNKRFRIITGTSDFSQKNIASLCLTYWENNWDSIRCSHCTPIAKNLIKMYFIYTLKKYGICVWNIEMYIVITK